MLFLLSCLSVTNHVRSLSFEPLGEFSLQMLIRRCAQSPYNNQSGLRSQLENKGRMIIYLVCSISLEPLDVFWNILQQMFFILRWCAEYMLLGARLHLMESFTRLTIQLHSINPW